MTKNLFLLFSIYCFIVQAIILGFLTGDSVYYKLAGINAIAMLLIGLIYYICTAPNRDEGWIPWKSWASRPNDANNREAPLIRPIPEGKTPEGKNEKSKEPLAEKSSVQKIVQPIPPTTKRKRKSGKRGQRLIFLLSIAIAVAIHLFITCEFLTYRSLLLCLIIGFILFLTIGKILDINGFYKAGRLATSRLYYIILLLAAGYAGIYMYGKGELLEQYIPELRRQTNIHTTKQPEEIEKTESDNPDYVYEITGEVISESTNGDDDLPDTNNEGITDPNNTPENFPDTTSTTTIPWEIKNVTMMEAIKHIISANKIPLSTKTDITFSSLAKNNADYKYFKTAYEKRMIGKNTEPHKQISCETYIVIKGLAENRSVGNYTDVKAAYRSKAESLNKLNGCKKGGRVTTATL